MSLKRKMLSCACSFSAFALYELNVIDLMILICIVFSGSGKYGEADPQLVIAYWRYKSCQDFNIQLFEELVGR